MGRRLGRLSHRVLPIDLKKVDWASATVNQPIIFYWFNRIISNLLDVAKGCEAIEGSIAFDKLKPLPSIILP